MNLCYITFRSVTFAQRGERILGAGGIGCSLQRTPRWMEEQGCGYCLRIKEQEVARAVRLLKQNGLPMRKVYCQEEKGVLREMAL